MNFFTLEVRLAWRNLWRNPIRNFLLICLIIIVLGFGTYAVAFLNGLSFQRLQDQLNYSLGHLKITHPQFDQAKNVHNFIPNFSAVKGVLQRNASIEAFSGRCNVRALAQKNNRQWGIDLYGVDAKAEKQTLQLYQKITQGKYLSEKSNQNEVVIGQSLAQKMNIRVGDSLILQMIDKEGFIKTKTWQVVGIYKYVNQKFESTHIFVPIESLQKALNLPTNAVHQIIIRLKDRNITDTQVLDYQAKWPNLKIQSWQKTAPELAYLDVLMEYFFWIFNGIILFVLLMAIVNTMLMNILERSEEFGLLKILGMNNGRILKLIFWETLFIVFLGASIGLSLAGLSIYYGQNYGLDLSIYSAAWAGWGSSPIVYPFLKPYDLLKITSLLISTAFIAALYPTYLILQKTALQLRNSNV